MKSIHLFLGANSGAGFADLYGQLYTTFFRDLAILKGGPGCGKSTLMRTAAQAMERAGLDTVYIHCSGDPDSLDGVIFPQLRTAIADGTAPHVLEPQYMAVQSRYVNLSPLYDLEHIAEKRQEIITLTDAYRAAYAESYHTLRALDALDAERRAIIGGSADMQRLRRRTAGIIARELKGKKGSGGAVAKAFLGGYTCKGRLCFYDTAGALCQRIYEIEDSYGLGSEMLQSICAAAVERGERVLACPDPMRPQELRHLLIPGRALGFVTVGDGCASPLAPYRRIRLDALAEQGLTRTQKMQLRFIRRVRRELETEVVRELAQAKEKHDRLEECYRPYVDFTGVSALAGEEITRLTARAKDACKYCGEQV